MASVRAARVESVAGGDALPGFEQGQPHLIDVDTEIHNTQYKNTYTHRALLCMCERDR